MCFTEPVRLQPVVAAESGHFDNNPIRVPEHTLREDDNWWASRRIREVGLVPQWITYDVKEPWAITKIGFRGYNGTRCPRDVILQSSEARDGPWADVLPFTARQTKDLQEFDVPHVPHACRYWRVLMNTNHGWTDPGPSGMFGLYEVRFFGVKQ